MKVVVVGKFGHDEQAGRRFLRGAILSRAGVPVPAATTTLPPPPAHVAIVTPRGSIAPAHDTPCTTN